MPATSMLYPALWFHGQPQGEGYGFNSAGQRIRPSKVKLPGVKFGDTPVKLTCPGCKREVTTAAVEEDGDCTLTLLSLAMIFLCFIPCLFIERCKDTVHYCPECKQEIGRYTRNRFRPYKPTESTNAADKPIVVDLLYSEKSKEV